MKNETTNLLSHGVHEVIVDSLRQRYHVYGSGPVCLAVPGGPGVSWEALRAPALEQFMTMVYIEPLGTGGSDRLPSHPHGYSRARYARSLIAMLDRLSLSRAFLLGHSHGGFVAQYIAIHHPDRLDGLVLYESAPVTGPEHMAEAASAVEAFIERNQNQPGLPESLAGLQSVGTITDDAKLTTALRDLLPIYFARYWDREAEFNELRKQVTCTYISSLDENGEPDTIDDRAALTTLAVPTLVIVGRHDVICGTRWARELHTLIPQSHLTVLEDSGHFGHVEEPDAFADAVRTFMQTASA